MIAARFTIAPRLGWGKKGFEMSDYGLLEANKLFWNSAAAWQESTVRVIAGGDISEVFNTEQSALRW
jgi:hypothetical protein